MNRDIEALQRALAADPCHTVQQCRLRLAQSRIDGPDLLLNPLTDHQRWAQTPRLLQDLAIFEVERRLSHILSLSRIDHWTSHYCVQEKCQHCSARWGYWSEKTKQHHCGHCQERIAVHERSTSYRLATFIHKESGLELQLIPGQKQRKFTEKYKGQSLSKKRVMELTGRSLKPFLIGRWPVVEADDSPDASFKPKVDVNYEDAQKWLKSRQLRLPNKEEWLYAAAAGFYKADRPWTFHSDLEPISHSWNLTLFEERQGRLLNPNLKPTLHECSEHDDQKLWNPFGLVDMFGNVWEWLSDTRIQRDQKDWPLIAGGSYKNLEYNLSNPFSAAPPELQSNAHGFRPACSIPTSKRQTRQSISNPSAL